MLTLTYLSDPAELKEARLLSNLLAALSVGQELQFPVAVDEKTIEYVHMLLRGWGDNRVWKFEREVVVRRWWVFKWDSLTENVLAIQRVR